MNNLMDNSKNRHILTILYHICEILNNKDYINLNTNYLKIKKEKEKMDEDEDNTIISNYNYLIDKPNNIIFKKKDNYIIVIFLESFFRDYYFKKDIQVSELNIIFKKITHYIINHIYFDQLVEVCIISPDEYKDFLSKKIDNESVSNIYRLYKYSELLYDPTKHKCFNKHEKIKNFDKKYKKFGLKIPELVEDDIACKWLGYIPDDIIKITRDDESIKDNKSIYYRKVVKKK